MKSRRRRIVSLLAIIMVSGLVAFNPRPVFAFMGVGDQTFATIVADMPRTMESTATKAAEVVKARVKDSIAIAFKQAAKQFLATVTQEFATSLATTAPGQKPLFLTSPMTFFRDVADAAAGDFIDAFTRGVTGSAACNDPDPAVRQRCLLLTGSNGIGEPTSGARGKFIITKLLLTAVNSSADLCMDNAKNASSIVNTKSDLMYSGLPSLSSADKWGKFNNDFEREVSFLLSQKKWLEDKVKSDAGQVVTCRQVVDQHLAERIAAALTGSPPADVEPNYVFNFDWCRVDDASTTSSASCRTTAAECDKRIDEGIRNIYATAADVGQGLRTQCRTGMGADIRSYVNQKSATDIFAAAENFDVRQSPQLIAARFKGNSDISQYFQAAALLTSSVQAQVTGNQTLINTKLLPRTAKVSQKVLSPAEASSALFGIPFYNNNGELTYTGTGAADIIRAVASFINSPVGKALFTYFRSKCGVNPDACKGPSNSNSVVGQILFGSGGATGIAAAQIQFASIGKLDAITGNPGNNEIDILTQLSAAGLLDPQFQTAISNGDTVRQAMTKNLLSANRIIGFDKNGIEPKDGYPYRSLQYLRKYRIIPIGWELAAKYAYAFRSEDLTLGTLTEQYDLCAQDDSHKVCSDTLKACKDNAGCSTNATCGPSPYCGLVDPDWVLKAPQTYCRRQGAGEEIISKEFVCDKNNVDKTTGQPIPNATVCQESTAADPSSTTSICHDVDPPNCVESDTNQFPDIGRWEIGRNTDTCADSQSCLVEADDGTCLGYGYCVQERQAFKFDGESCDAQNSTCTAYTDNSGKDVAYLAKNLDTNCSADSAGCKWYCAKSGYDDILKAWTCTANAPENKIHFTAKAQSCQASQAGCQQFSRLIPGTNLLPNGGFEYYELGAIDQDPAIFSGWTAPLNSLYPITATDEAGSSGNVAAVRIRLPAPGDTISQTVDLGTPPNDRRLTFSVRAMAAASCTAHLTVCTGADCSSSSIHPTLDFNPTDSWQTYAATMDVPVGAVTNTHVTVSIRPDTCRDAGLVLDNAQLEFGTATSFREYATSNLIYMNNKRLSCNSADVGCDSYTPVGGGPVVNAVLTSANLCTADQVGCQLYHREPISQLPTRDYDPAAANGGGANTTIVATKGQQCSAANVGCEEYTNLDTVSGGGEAKAYFTNIKQCVKPTNTAAHLKTYYTWYGDPGKGFVLRSQQLVESNINPDSTAVAPPCTNLAVAKAGGPDPACADTAATIAAATCSAADLATDPDCAEFYDSNLNVSYRLRSKTVSVAADCHPYRNTIDDTDPAYASSRNNVYYLSAKENKSCPVSAASCRAFTGNNGRASRAVLTDAITDPALANWVGGSYQAASPNAGGHSIRIDLAPGQTKGAVYTKESVLSGKLLPGKTYLLTVTAAAAENQANIHLRAFLGHETSPGVFEDLGGFPLSSGTGLAMPWNSNVTPPGPEWHTTTFGPVTIGATVDPTWRLGLIADNGEVYVDSVKFTEVSNLSFLINNSAPQCTAIGCTAYKARSGALNYATSFDHLCSSQAVGCEALIDTQNSRTPFTQTTKNVTVPADRVVTMVNNPGIYCPAAAKGCDTFGEPIMKTDNTLSSIKTVYKINDPDRYSGDLCLAKENGCNVFTASDGTTSYFRDPNNQTCEYRGSSGVTAGWYISGTQFRCPITTPPSVGQPVGASCSPVCVGGTRDGKACTITGSSTECPGGGTCQGEGKLTGRIFQPRCVGGTNPGTACVIPGSTTECAGGGTCQVGAATAGNIVYGQCSTDDLGHDNCATSTPAPDHPNKCIYLVGICPIEQNGCTEYRDPTDPPSCRSECPLELMGGTAINVDSNCARTVCTSTAGSGNKRDGQNCSVSADCTYRGIPGICVGLDGRTPTTGAPGCRPYYELKQSVLDTAGECNGQVNTALGCRSFNDTSNPTLNFRGQ